MSARAIVPVEEYLRTSYPDLDREYRDGEIVERSLPDYLHGKMQYLLGLLLGAFAQRVPIFPCFETRMKLREKLYLVPDVAVFYPNEPSQAPRAVPETPPLIVIEILSLDDRLSEVRAKLELYREWGVPHVWLVDPHGKRMYTCDAGLVEVSILSVRELGVEISAEQLFG